jgi:hypothetical protein
VTSPEVKTLNRRPTTFGDRFVEVDDFLLGECPPSRRLRPSSSHYRKAEVATLVRFANSPMVDAGQPC